MRLIAKITAILLVFLLMFLPLLFARIFKFEKITAWVMQSAFIAGNKILSLKVNIKGEIAKSRPLLIISNHFSYLDVFALGSVGDIKFTPKSDVGSWLVIGLFAKMAGCIFIDRRRSGTLRNKNAVSDAILQGKAISIFPEGTTGDGTALLPFKSSLFSIIDKNKLLIQPVTINYRKLNSQNINTQNKHLVGWYADMEFFPHLLELLKQTSLEVDLIFHQPITSDKFASRKDFAVNCREIVEKDFCSYSS